MALYDPSTMIYPTADMIHPMYLEDAGDDKVPLDYSYTWPEEEGTRSTGETYVPAGDDEIAAHPWLKAYTVTGVVGAPNNGRDWGPEHVTNSLRPGGLFPHIGRAPRKVLRPDSVPPDVIHRPKRDMYQEELHGPSFKPRRRDVAEGYVADRIKEDLALKPQHSTYGAKNFMQPGATYGPGSMGGMSAGFAHGLQLVQRSTNKHAGRVRTLVTPSADHIDRGFREENVRRTNIGVDRTKFVDNNPTGFTEIGRVTLPRRKEVHAREGGPTGFGALHRNVSQAVKRSMVPLKVTRRSAYTQHFDGESFAHAFAPGHRNARKEDPSLLRLDDPSISFEGASFSAPLSSGTTFSEHGAPVDKFLVTPGADYQCQGSSESGHRAGAFIFAQEEEEDDVPEGCDTTMAFSDSGRFASGFGRFGAPSRAGGRKFVLRSAHPNEEGGTQDRQRARRERLDRHGGHFGPLGLNRGSAYSLLVTDGAVNRETNWSLRSSKRAYFLEARDPHQNRTLSNQRADWLHAPQIRQKRRTPMIEREIDIRYNAPFLNNPYRNQPVGDGCGGWLPIGRHAGVVKSEEDIVSGFA